VTTGDSRIYRELLQGQEVFLPTLDAWHDILRVGTLDGMPVRLPDWIICWLDSYARFEVTALGLVRMGGMGWMPQALLRLDQRALRVHFEDVICEHCNRRCGPSAAPDTMAYAGTGYTAAQAWAEFDGLAVQLCPHCGGEFRRRQVIWLAASNAVRQEGREPIKPK
jgi:hypothetical protein